MHLVYRGWHYSSLLMIIRYMYLHVEREKYANHVCFSCRIISLKLLICTVQEIVVLVTLFCLFQASVGLILPSLAKLRTMYAEQVLFLSFFLIFFPVKKGIIVSILFNLELLLLFLGIPRYVPNELRCGMISLSQAPAHAAILFFMVQVRISYLWSLQNR